jgi:hypothetical protein
LTTAQYRTNRAATVQLRIVLLHSEKIMRIVTIAATTLIPTLVATTADAAVPNPVAALLGPSVGYLLSQSDLCQWGLSEKIEKTYQSGFKAIGMTAAQQATAWEQAKSRQRDLANLPAEAKARMKSDTCTPADRARVDRNLAD